MRAPPASTFRTLSSCLIVARPAYRLFTTTIPGQTKLASRSATSSSLETKAGEAELKPAETQKVKRLVPPKRQTKSASRSATSSSLETKAGKAKLKLAETQQVKRLVPPKRPVTIWHLVTRDVFAAEVSAVGKLTGEKTWKCMRLAAERYRALSDEERKSYQAEVEQRCRVYEVEMRQFLDSVTPQDYASQNEHKQRHQAQGRSTYRWKKATMLDPNAPKGPTDAFKLFCADLRADPTKFVDFPGFPNGFATSLGAEIKVLGAYWKEMKKDGKQKYLLEAQRLKESYKQEMKQYTSRNGQLPKKPTTAFFLFCKELHANPTKFSDFPGFPKTSPWVRGDAPKVLAAYWREMKDNVKQEYFLESQRQKETYIKEMAQYSIRTAMLNSKHNTSPE